MEQAQPKIYIAGTLALRDLEIGDTVILVVPEMGVERIEVVTRTLLKQVEVAGCKFSRQSGHQRRPYGPLKGGGRIYPATPANVSIWRWNRQLGYSQAQHRPDVALLRTLAHRLDHLAQQEPPLPARWVRHRDAIIEAAAGLDAAVAAYLSD